jgi:cell wall-associated NlpC family hydrolase
MKVSLATVLLCFQHTVGRVKYQLGAKPSLGSDSSSFSLSDCSGWVRWALDRAGLSLPDGSATQHEWCAANLRSVDYDNAATQSDPSRLFIAFIAPGGGIGHVWLLQGGTSAEPGRTMECHGSRGVDSRPFDTPILANVCACYELPTSA